MDFFYSNIVWITDVLMVLGIIILCKIIGPLFAYILICLNYYSCQPPNIYIMPQKCLKFNIFAFFEKIYYNKYITF